MMFVDADDWLVSDCVEKALQALEQTDSVCVVFESYIADTKGNKRIALHCEKTMEWQSGNRDFIYGYLGDISRYVGTSVWNKLYVSQIIKENNLRFTDLKIGADTIFCLEYATYPGKWVRINVPLYWYYQNESSVMHRYDKNFAKKIMQLMVAYSEFAKRYNRFGDLRRAVQSKCVIDYYVILRYEYENSPKRLKRKRLQFFINNDRYRARILGADTHNLSGRYKLVYLLIRFKATSLLQFLLWIYFNRYWKLNKGKVED